MNTVLSILLMDIYLFSQISSRLKQIFLLQHQKKLY